MNITWAVLDEVGELVKDIMRMHQPEIDKAYLKLDGALTLSLSAKFKPTKDGTFEIEAGISFTAEKVKDSIVKYYNEKQGELFEFKKGE
jgi:hypothetical protein